jgi:hypothetical protein
VVMRVVHGVLGFGCLGALLAAVRVPAPTVRPAYARPHRASNGGP